MTTMRARSGLAASRIHRVGWTTGMITPSFQPALPGDPVQQDHIVRYPFEFSFGHQWPLE